MNWNPFWLSLQVTFIAGAIILIVGTILAWTLARLPIPGKLWLETFIMLPLILPPSVIGYYLLFVLGRGSFLAEQLRVNLLFTPTAAVIAAAVVGMPLLVQSARAAFEAIEPEIEAAARADGASTWQTFRLIILPLARRGILAGMILATARAFGEFGATLMIAGNIPGRTQTLPLAIYDAVQSNRQNDATMMALVMSSVAFTGLWSARWLSTSRTNNRNHRASSKR